MPLATKNNAIIVKDGLLAENCGCCGGWYCYRDSCACWRAFVQTLTAANAGGLVPMDSIAYRPWTYSYNYTFPITDGTVVVQSSDTDPDTLLPASYSHRFEYNGIAPCSALFIGYPLVTQNVFPFPRRSIEVRAVTGAFLELRATFGVLNRGYTNWDAITAFSFGGYSYSGQPFALASADADTFGKVYTASYATSIGYAGPNIVADEDFKGTISVSGRLQNDAGTPVSGTQWSLSFAFHPLIYGF